ncbi:MAG: hypothetical protein ABIS08_01680 [Pseudolysinimonas sp.]
MYGPIGHGFGTLAGIFGVIVWALGTFILLAILVVLIVLLARFLWFGTKASQRYLELNGSPAPRMRATAAAAAPTPAPSATGGATAPAAQRGAGAPAPGTVTKPAAGPKTPKPPVV